MNYDLAALDDKDFESLSVDLLGVLFGCRIERFKPGKDAGVDGRWFVASGQEAIVQCKHWIRTGYDRLVKHLSTVEKPKLSKLKPKRYILVTSVELSRKNKQKIAAALHPHIVSDSDIFGREDIDDLLARNPDIERRHYKLWLVSAAVLNHIINNAVYGRSGFDTNEIRQKTPVFVRTSDFDKAEALLNARQVAIITGVPGIGKTTLAEQLVVKLLADGFELASLTDIIDGESVFDAKKKQVFYFDDFLGRNFLEAIKLKHDSQIVHFIKRVAADKQKRFILTSRSSILNQGKHLSDLFALGKTEKNEYEVRIGGLSKLEKAKILYSHIWHSNLSDEVLDQLFANRRYKTIAEHPNYNPRLISFITDSDVSGSITADKFWDYVVNTLQNPQNLWDHFFGQLSQDCRDLVQLVVFNGRVISEQTLARAFRKLRTAEGLTAGAIEDNARVALKICTGSVLNRNIDPETGKIQYDLYNPSIGDYIVGKLEECITYSSFFTSLRTTSSLNTLQTYNSSDIITHDDYLQMLDSIATAELKQELDNYSCVLIDYLLNEPALVSKHFDFLRDQLNSIDISTFPGSDDLLLTMIASGIRYGLLEESNTAILKICDRVKDWDMSSDDFPTLAELVSLATGDEGTRALSIAKGTVMEYWKNYVSDYINDSELLRDIYDPSQYYVGLRELREVIAEELKGTGFSFNQSEVDAICQSVNMDDIAERNIQWDENSYFREPEAPKMDALSEDQMIDDLFDRDR